jgi:Acetyltransferase (GNAT) domain
MSTALRAPTIAVVRDRFRLDGATLFHEDWWLNAATGGRWDIVTVERDGVVVASMPFVLRNRFALRFLTMPPYTRTLGPLLANLPTKPSKRLSAQVELLQTLLAKVPKHDRFEMRLSPESDLTLAFVACSYVVTNTFTFTWDGKVAADQLLREMQPLTRRKIQASAKRLHAERHTDIDRFIRMSVLEHGRFTNNNDFEVIRNIFQACSGRKQAMVLSAVNESGKDVAVSVLVWGRGVLYNLLAARHPENAGPGANSFLVWKAMQAAQEKGLSYDSDGVYSPHAAVFYSRFGLTPKVRPTVNQGNNWWKLMFMAKATLRPRSVDLYYRS